MQADQAARLYLILDCQLGHLQAPVPAADICDLSGRRVLQGSITYQ